MTAIRVADLMSYLDATGWRRQPEAPWPGASVWEHADGHSALLPAREDMDDAAERSQEVLRMLATIEGRQASEIEEDIRHPLVDTQTIHTHPTLPSGYVDLLTGRKIVNAVRDLYATAARTAVEGPRLRFRGRPSTPVEDFLRTVQLGPSKAGSYVLTLRIPMEAPSQPQLWDDGRPLPRQTVTLLHRAVAATRIAASVVAVDPMSYSAFDEAVEHGVSADLCEALSDLSGVRQQWPFEISFRWARGITPLPATETVAFPAGTGVVIRQAGEKLKALADSGWARITGLVLTMHDDPPSDRWRIRVRGELATENALPESPRSLWIRLSESEYERARSAQQRQLKVRAEGRLEVARRRTELVPDAEGLMIFG